MVINERAFLIRIFGQTTVRSNAVVFARARSVVVRRRVVLHSNTGYRRAPFRGSKHVVDLRILVIVSGSVDRTLSLHKSSFLSVLIANDFAGKSALPSAASGTCPCMRLYSCLISDYWMH